MKLLLIGLLSSLSVTSSIYNIPVNGADSSQIDLSSFQGKKILFVNIATNSTHITQLAKLQDLQEEHGDSLVVIAFPSNSFGNESRSDSEIVQFCQSNYAVTFPIAAKGSVHGSNIQGVYNWLTRSAENSVLDQEVKSDFQKFLLSRNGEVIGVFAGSVEPDNVALVQAIEN